MQQVQASVQLGQVRVAGQEQSQILQSMRQTQGAGSRPRWHQRCLQQGATGS
jgi:hypothetical protein